MNKKFVMPALTAAIAIVLAGCNTTAPKDDMSGRLQSIQAENADLRSSLADLKGSVSERDARIAALSASQGSTDSAGNNLLPPSAKTGECYARVFVPPTYATVEKNVMTREQGSRIETAPAKYQWGEEQVLVKEATETIKVVPATYKWVEEQVLVKEASTDLVEVPAQYQNVNEKILVREAYTTWKKGTGPIQKIDEATGEIMCLVEVPAEYKTITKRVVVKPASVREVSLPAEYKTVKRRVVDQPAKTVTVVVPAEYKTLKVRKMVEGPKQRSIDIPAEYKTVRDQKLVSAGKLEWRPILCETNTNGDIVRRLQQALKNAGYNPGPIDGIIGKDTMAAVTSYQKANNMAAGQLTMETLKKLGVVAS